MDTPELKSNLLMLDLRVERRHLDAIYGDLSYGKYGGRNAETRLAISDAIDAIDRAIALLDSQNPVMDDD